MEKSDRFFRENQKGAEKVRRAEGIFTENRTADAAQRESTERKNGSTKEQFIEEGPEEEFCGKRQDEKKRPEEFCDKDQIKTGRSEKEFCDKDQIEKKRPEEKFCKTAQSEEKQDRREFSVKRNQKKPTAKAQKNISTILAFSPKRVRTDRSGKILPLKRQELICSLERCAKRPFRDFYTLYPEWEEAFQNDSPKTTEKDRFPYPKAGPMDREAMMAVSCIYGEGNPENSEEHGLMDAAALLVLASMRNYFSGFIRKILPDRPENQEIRQEYFSNIQVMVCDRLRFYCFEEGSLMTYFSEGWLKKAFREAVLFHSAENVSRYYQELGSFIKKAEGRLSQKGILYPDPEEIEQILREEMGKTGISVRMVKNYRNQRRERVGFDELLEWCDEKEGVDPEETLLKKEQLCAIRRRVCSLKGVQKTMLRIMAEQYEKKNRLPSCDCLAGRMQEYYPGVCFSVQEIKMLKQSVMTDLRSVSGQCWKYT